MLRFLFPSRLIIGAMLATAFVFMMAMAGSPQHGSSYAQETGGGSGTEEAQGSPATSDPETVDQNGDRVRCAELPEAKGGVLLGKIIPCLLRTIENGSIHFSTEMIDWLRPLFYAFLTFVITMFGLKLLQGEGQFQSEAIVLLIKIGFAMAILNMIPTTLIPISYGIMAESQEIVMGAIGPDDSNIHCPIQKFKGENTPLIWAQMDCLLGKLYGFTVGQTDGDGNKRPNMLLASSMLGLLGGFFFGGTFGAALFFMCLGVLFTMFMMVMRVVMAFVNSYLIIALYMIIAPLFVPLIFLKATGQYFEKWWSGILAALLMPLVICAYMVFALQAYDRILLDPGTEGDPESRALIYNIFDNEWIKKAQELPSQACDMQLTTDPRQRSAMTGIVEKVLNLNPFIRNTTNPGLTGGNNPCAFFKKQVLNMKNAPGTEGYKDDREIFSKLFRDCVKLLVMAMLIDAGFKALTGAIRPALGSGAVVATLDVPAPQEYRLQSGLASAKASFSRTFDDGSATGVSGVQFVERLPGAVKNAFDDGNGGGFFNGISRN